MKKRPPILFSTLLRWLGTVVSAVLFIWLVARQDWAGVLTVVGQIPLWALILAPALYALSFGFNTLRWCTLLWVQGVKISYWQALKIVWAGNFASNFLPSTVGGDGFRVLAVYPFTHSKSLALGSVALDRLINMATMACLIPVSVGIFGDSWVLRRSVFLATKQSAANNKEILRAYPPIFAVILPLWAKRLIEKYSPKIVPAFQDWASYPTAFLWAFLVAWPSNLIPMAGTFIMARSLGIEVTYLQVIGAQTITYFLSVLPISINGLGLREIAYATLYATLGATIEQASTLALLIRLITTIISLPGALWLTNPINREPPIINI